MAEEVPVDFVVEIEGENEDGRKRRIADDDEWKNREGVNGVSRKDISSGNFLAFDLFLNLWSVQLRVEMFFLFGGTSTTFAA